MIILGLTGSIAMGKSTAGALLESFGVPVHEADVAARGAAHLLPEAFPEQEYPQLYPKGGGAALDRKALARLVFQDQDEAARLEALIHPHVRAAQARFIAHHQRAGTRLIALDIPLLFETGADAFVDYTLVITAPPFLQRARALRRPGMDEALFAAILARQWPDKDKCAAADFVVHSGQGRAAMAKELRQMIERILTPCVKSS